MATPAVNVVPSANEVVNASPALTSGQVGIFTTPQSLVTFPVATAAVTTIWKVSGNVYPPLDTNKLMPFFIALAIGFLIYLASVSRGATLRQKIIEAGVAIINTFTIAAAALGISKV